MEKYILVSLDEKKSKELAQVITNDTARKILDYLGEKETASPAELAKRLAIPLPSITYNLQHLETQGLIDKKDFAWSEKGRKVHLYALAKKLIIIAPKGFDWHDTLKKIVPVALIGIVISAVLKYTYVPVAHSLADTQELALEATKSISTPVTNYYWLYALIVTGVVILAIIAVTLWRRKRT